MADESQYSVGNDATTPPSLKRKYNDDQPPTHRPTRFSDTPEAPPPLSYNSVPPPSATGIELAKQRAQEVAARLLSGAPPLDPKRPKVDNDAPTVYDSIEPLISPSYGHQGQGASKKIDIPNGRFGVIIGKGGETIKYLQLQSGAKIQITRDMDADHNSLTRTVELMGTPDAIASAEKLTSKVLAEAESGGSGIVTRLTGQAGSDEFVTKIPNNKVGLVIGKGGETIKNMQASTGARIQVIPLHLPPGDTSTKRTLKVEGTPEQIESAKQLVDKVISGDVGENEDGGVEKWLFEVLKHLDAWSLAMAVCVSKRWRRTAQDEWLWELICSEQWPNTGLGEEELLPLVAVVGGFRLLYSQFIWPRSYLYDIDEYLRKLEVLQYVSL